jgi:hypothetical protein
VQLVVFACLTCAIDPEETVAAVERNLPVLAVILELAWIG